MQSVTVFSFKPPKTWLFLLFKNMKSITETEPKAKTSRLIMLDKYQLIKTKLVNTLNTVEFDRVITDTQSVYIHNLVYENKPLLMVELTINPVNYSINLSINNNDYNNKTLYQGVEHLKIKIMPIIRLYSDISNIKNN